LGAIFLEIIGPKKPGRSPQRPYTNIAFNTYEVVVIEAAKPSGDTPMNLQRYFDQVGADGSVVVPGPKDGLTTSNSAFKAEDLEKQLNPMLANRKGSGGEFWKLSKLAEANGKLTGTATLVGGSNKPADLTNMTQLEQWVAEQSNGKFVAGSITLTEAK